MTDDHQLARDLADAAGALLLQLRADRGFADPDVLRAAGDACSHEFLAARLAQERPEDAVLSEEGADSEQRLSAERVWIVDPLDGTREFGEEGRTDWAVHVALYERDSAPKPAEPAPVGDSAPKPAEPAPVGDSAAKPAEPAPVGRIVAAAVALPGLGTTLGTDAPPAVPAMHEGALRIAVSRSRAPQFLQDVAADLGAELVRMGSAGAKATAVVRGEVDAYLHSGGQYEWDSAAPVGVALAAGLHCSRLDGSPLAYNQPDPYLPDLLVCRPQHAEELIASSAAALQSL